MYPNLLIGASIKMCVCNIGKDVDTASVLKAKTSSNPLPCIFAAHRIETKKLNF